MNESRQGVSNQVRGQGAPTDEVFLIRRINWHDWKELAVLFHGIFPELKKGLISHHIRHYEDTISVAEADTGLAGFYHFIPKADVGITLLNYLGVIPAYQRVRVGSRLLFDFERRTAEMGYGRVELDVLQQNDKAIRFYEKHGYTRIHPVDGKYRYYKVLAACASAVYPETVRNQTWFKRLGRRVLYLLLVSLPLMFADY